MTIFERALEAWLRPRGYQQLFLFDSWGATVVLIVAGLAVSFFAFGFWWPYWRTADMDLWMGYEGLLLNDGLAQEWFDHPGYLSILLNGNWFRLLHGIGLLDVHALSLMPSPAESGDAWTHAVRAGRVLSLGVACGFVITFAMLLRRLIGNWRVAALGAFALAFSGGLAMQARVMRTELISGGCLTTALLILLIAARTPRMAWRPALVGLSALLVTLAMINKVQVVFLVCMLPILVLPFGVRLDDPHAFWRKPRRALSAASLYVIGAVLVAIPAWPLVWFGISAAESSIIPWRPFLWNTFGTYQVIIAAWIVLAMGCFAVTWRVPPLEVLAALAAVAGGFALGMLSLDIRYHPQNVLAVMNPLEQLFVWATASDPDLANGGGMSGRLLLSLLSGIGEVAARETFILQSSARPTIFLQWLVIAATIVAAKAGERKLVLQVAALMAVTWMVDIIGTLRGLKIEYFIYTDPLVIIAAALLLAGLPQLQSHRWAYQIGALLIAAHIIVSQAEPVKHTFSRSVPMNFCIEHFEYTKRIERFSFCPSPST